MTNRFSALLLAAVVSSVGACAASPAAAPQTDGSVSTEAAPAPPDSTTLRMRGTIGKYDSSTRVLSLSTSNGTVQFPVSSVARIRRGGRSVAASELESLHGYPAAVRYSESGGTRTVESVHVLENAKR